MDGSSTDIEVLNEAAGALAEKISALPFIEQLNVLSERLEEENVEMTHVLQEKLAAASSSKAKGGKAKSSASSPATETASSTKSPEPADDAPASSEKRPHTKSDSSRHHKTRSGSSGGH